MVKTFALLNGRSRSWLVYKVWLSKINNKCFHSTSNVISELQKMPRRGESYPELHIGNANDWWAFFDLLSTGTFAVERIRTKDTDP